MAKKKTIIINHKEYVMPKASVDAYMHYLEVRDEIMNTEKKNGLYTFQQFKNMMECICEMYGNQFTVDELKDSETGLDVAGIVMEFAAIEVGIGENVNEKAEKFQKNFTNGK